LTKAEIREIIDHVNQRLNETKSNNIAIFISKKATDEDIRELAKHFKVVRRDPFGYIHFECETKLGPVKGEQTGMLGVPGKYVEQKRPWIPGQMGFESYTKYVEAMDRKYTLSELQELCRQHGVSASGDKKTLVRRLF